MFTKATGNISRCFLFAKKYNPFFTILFQAMQLSFQGDCVCCVKFRNKFIQR